MSKPCTVPFVHHDEQPCRAQCLVLVLFFKNPGLLEFAQIKKNKVIVNIKGCFYSLLIILLGDFLLIPKYGITAAAGVSSCGYLFYFGYVLNIFVKEYKVSLKDFFYFKKADIYKIKNILLKK